MNTPACITNCCSYCHTQPYLLNTLEKDSIWRLESGAGEINPCQSMLRQAWIDVSFVEMELVEPGCIVRHMDEKNIYHIRPYDSLHMVERLL